MTIGLPVRNGGATVRRALGSLQAQTYPNLEILVSDNHSDDGTTEIVAEIARTDPRVRHVRQSANIGMMPNFEYVVREADGDLFAWAASDDGWDPAFISTLVALLDEHPEAGLAMSSVRTLDPAGAEVDTIRFERWTSLIGKPRWLVAAQMMKIVPGPPLHYFIYGLWRKPLLDQLMSRPFPRVRAGDRVLMCEAALGTLLVDSPHVLYDRTVQQGSLTERYAEDPLAAAWLDPAADRHYLFTLGRRLVTSPVIPLRRRLAMALPLWFVQVLRRRHLLWKRAVSS